MKGVSTVAMAVAGVAAAAVVIALGMAGGKGSASTPAPVQGTPPATTPTFAPNVAPPVVKDDFPANAFPREWHYHPSDDRLHSMIRASLARPAPALTVGEFLGTGGTADLSALRGTPVLIDFWGTWCGPCRASVPEINKIAELYKDKLHVIGVHSTRQAAQMGSAAAQLGMKYPTAADLQNRTSSAYNVQWWPFYVLIDSKGIVRAAGLSSNRLHDAVVRLMDIESGRWTGT